jgi:L-threonylcarbamoyladenylate synthase
MRSSGTRKGCHSGMRIFKVDPETPEPEAIREAGEAIRSGQLVIFPTETVYGLAANALDCEAVRMVFQAKRRALSIPLPVQVGDRARIAEVAVELSRAARLLIERFMPGPITLVLRRNPAIPNVVTAGGDTVGVRIPDNPVALALLKEAGMPIVATSANLSGRPEPLNADEAVEQVGKCVDIVLDAGPSRLGRASTVIDTTVDPPRVLRRGALTVKEIREVIGELVE